MKKKKIKFSTVDLDKNLDSINEFLSKRGLSEIRGGSGIANNSLDSPDWGNSNYAESTYVRHT